MWDPPPGFADLLGDATLAPRSDRDWPLTVPDVGSVRAYRPGPGAAAHLGMAVNPEPELPDDTEDPKAAAAKLRDEHLTLFIIEHLAPGEHERILENLVTTDLPADTMGRIARALATWGTARPYLAVASLSLTAATHWRLIRTRLRANGITNPMLLLSLHDVLDEAEKLWLESETTGKEEQDHHNRVALFDRLYGPEPTSTARKVNGRRYRAKIAPPPGFSPAEVEANFDSLSQSLSGR